MFGRKKASEKAQNPNTKLISAYQVGVPIQQIADENDMTTAEVMAIVVKQ